MKENFIYFQFFYSTEETNGNCMSYNISPHQQIVMVMALSVRCRFDSVQRHFFITISISIFVFIIKYFTFIRFASSILCFSGIDRISHSSYASITGARWAGFSYIALNRPITCGLIATVFGSRLSSVCGHNKRAVTSANRDPASRCRTTTKSLSCLIFSHTGNFSQTIKINSSGRLIHFLLSVFVFPF